MMHAFIAPLLLVVVVVVVGGGGGGGGGVQGCEETGSAWKFKARGAGGGGGGVGERGRLKLESKWEEMFLQVPSNDTARMHLRHYTRNAHLSGSAEDYKLAKYTQERMQSYGLQSKIEAVKVLLSEPIQRSLSLLDKSHKIIYQAKLSESIIPSDDTSDSIWRNKTFLGYAPSGQAIGRFVYANYGRPEDFHILESYGVNVRDSIVIVRYGKCFRGLKIMNAQERGAIGVIIYSDPAEDGYEQGSVYPDGPWRPATSVQRGSTQFNTRCSGDPSRAYSKKSTEELCGYKQEDLIPRIPAIPLSYEDAMPFLLRLGGPRARGDFVGALKLTYRLGPSRDGLMANLTTENNFHKSPVWNVITTIPGQDFGTRNDRPVIMGNHRDAWVFGAADPNSGSAIMLEVARGFGTLLKNGWKPKRSIILCSWSGEEQGLLGSTAYGEENAEGILKNAIAYLNVDVGVAGQVLKVGATLALSEFLTSVFASVPYPKASYLPNTYHTLLDAWDKEVEVLGSGSDYTVFLDRLGISSVDVRFTAKSGRNYGTYHSTYDSFSWMATHVDPSFKLHQTMAIAFGLMGLRLADSNKNQFQHDFQASSLVSYIESNVKDAIQVFGADNAEIQESYELVLNKCNEYLLSSQLSLVEEKNLNYSDRHSLAERAFLDEEGLPNRKWFRHLLQAPGYYLGYDGELLPGLMDVIRLQSVEKVLHEMLKISQACDRAAQILLVKENHHNNLITKNMKDVFLFSKTIHNDVKK